MRRLGTLLFLTWIALVVALGITSPGSLRAQTLPLATQPPLPTPPPPTVPPSAAPGSAAPSAPGVPGASPVPGESGAVPESPNPSPTVTPTPIPIIVEPPSSGVNPGGSQTLRLSGVVGLVSVTVLNPDIADASIDQDTRTLTVVGRIVGMTTATVKDERGETRDVAIRVAFSAGAISSSAYLRVTGRPASQQFLREQVLDAALKGVLARPGASIVANGDSIDVNSSLGVDDVTTIDVPIIVQGDAYFTVQGVTHVRVENFAQPNVRPKSLLVSDFPETLKANGILFEADLNPQGADRFLYFHYDPPGQPDRRIVLRAQNTSSQPALVQFIAGAAGPDANEMLVGHSSTERFLVRLAQNEGTVLTVPPNSTVSLMDQSLPASSIVSGLMQLHEIEGAPLHLTLVAQNASDLVDGPIATSALLQGGAPHARGIYPIPDFYFDYSYEADGPDLEISIGLIPLPNLVQGQTLAGDYGVLQDVTIRMVNNDRHNARDIAIYANPRGGRATGTFVIDRVLVRAHAMEPFGHYKLRQYTIPPGSFVRTEIVTMPEGGSSYPLRLVVAPDDGSAAPGTGDSPVY
jgi:Pilus formation protein N terminal region